MIGADENQDALPLPTPLLQQEEEGFAYSLHLLLGIFANLMLHC